MYAKQTWTNGDLIIASKLNHIEDGIDTNQLPEITTDDIGKYLIGVADFDNIIDSEVICPEQTVTISSDGDFPVPLTANTISDLCEYGIITVDGTDYLVHKTYNGEDLYEYGYWDSSPYYTIGYNSNNGNVTFGVNDASWTILFGTYTVSFSFVEPGVKWCLSNLEPSDQEDV